MRLILSSMIALAAALVPCQDEQPSEPIRLNNEGVKHHAAGRYADAVKLFDKAIDLQKIAGAVPDDVIVANLVSSLVGRAGLEITRGEYDAAKTTLHRARSFAPKDAQVHAYFGVLFYKQGYFTAAMDFLNDAVRLDGKSSLAHEFIGFVHYKREALERAVESWKRAIALQPSRGPALTGHIKKAEREIAVEGSMRTERSTHFICKYGDRQDREVAGLILRWLEEAYGDIGLVLHQYPREVLSVVLYADREFNRATGAHGWSAGLFDGKIRVPIKNFDRNRKEIRATLFHEYTHFLVASITGGCPAWLNEGLAQVYEGRRPHTARRLLQHARRGNDPLLPLSALTKTFARIPDARQAGIAYAQGLSFTHYLTEEYGLPRIEELLRALDGKRPFEEAFFRVFRRKLEDLEKSWLETL